MASPPLPAHVDVLVVGAGLSGVGAACHLQTRCPSRTWAIVEARDAIGGTWDLFRYPGVRSDSDMFTLGYRFRPWTGTKALADGPSIKAYIEETASAYGVDRRVHFRTRVTAASWSSREARWTVTLEVGPERRPARITCGFLYACTGYYDYDRGYTPEFPGAARFRGTVVHPQHWPEHLDCRGKRVVVIGSGATAITLVPALADQGAHVTMLQRTPTYVVSLPARDRLAERLQRALPERAAHAAARWKNVARTSALYTVSRRHPALVRRFIRAAARRALGPSIDVDTHFSPPYAPWDQRLCVAPDGDLFRALREGRASVVTDHVASFTETGVQLRSGAHLDADVIVTATGLVMKLLGGVPLTVDGAPVQLPRTVTYKGMMYSDVPNLAAAVGYTNASWTLKCDLVAEHVCRLLNHMERRGYTTCVPRLQDPGVTPEPAVGLTSGYVQRALDALPRQGSKLPWRLHQNYLRDLLTLRFGRVADPALAFSRAPAPAGGPPA